METLETILKDYLTKRKNLEETLITIKDYCLLSLMIGIFCGAIVGYFIRYLIK